MDEPLLDLARARGGLVTVPEAARLGISPARLNRLRATGLLVHVRRGAYALADTWSVASETERYALRTRAVLRTRSAVAASHHAALTLAGVPTWGCSLDRIDVVDVAGNTTRVRSKAGLVVHPHPPGFDPVADTLGDLCAPVATALVQLARDASSMTFAVALDQALRAGRATTSQVGAALHSRDQRARWVRQATDLLGAADPLSPSVEATRLRVLVSDMGFRPRLRVPIRLPGGSALLRPELMVGASIAVSRTAYSERERERLREVGIALAVVPDADLDHPHLVARSIAAAMGELDLLRQRRARGA